MNDNERKALGRGIRMVIDTELESIRDVLRRVLKRIEVLEAAQSSLPYPQAPRCYPASSARPRKPSTHGQKESPHAWRIR